MAVCQVDRPVSSLRRSGWTLAICTTYEVHRTLSSVADLECLECIPPAAPWNECQDIYFSLYIQVSLTLDQVILR